MNQVILQAGFRFRISEKLTRDEFLRRNRLVQSHDDAVTAEVLVRGSRIDLDSAVDVTEPGPQFLYFYAAELL